MRFILIRGPNEYWRAHTALEAMTVDSTLALLIKESTTTIARDEDERFVVNGDQLPEVLAEYVAQNNLSNTRPKLHKATRIKGDLAA